MRDRHARRPRRGTMLIVTIIVTFALAGMVLVLCRSMRVESLAAANAAAVTQASAVERGAEQYVLAMLAQEAEGVRDLSEDQFNGVRVGDGIFWIVRPQYDDADLPGFGLVEESAKINLNGATYEQLIRLPGMTYIAASSLLDWKDSNGQVERDGAESSYYLSLPEPYYCKDAYFETVEELLMVRGVTREMLYGDGTATPLGERTGFTGGMSSGGGAAGADGFGNDPQIARGLYDLLTVYSLEPNTTADGEQRININRNSRAMRRALQARLLQRFPSDKRQRVDQIVVAIGTSNMNDVFEFYRRANLKPDEFDLLADDLTTVTTPTIRGRININVAPRAALAALSGLEDADVDKLIAARGSATSQTSIGWVADAITPQKAAQARLGGQITTRTYQYSADIVATTSNGRAFKRVHIVVNMSTGTPQIIYRRDITDRGWPMDRQILTALRNGQYSSAAATGGPPPTRNLGMAALARAAARGGM